jgi:hypothetical protein
MSVGSLDSAPRILENNGFELVGYHDLKGQPGFKMALHEQAGRWFLYTGHLWHRGWSVIEVTDPSAPHLVRTIDGPNSTWTIQVQAADGLLVTALEKAVPGWGIEADAPFEEGALFWDISTDPTAPALLGSWKTGATGTHRNFYAGGPYAFMAATRPGYVGHGLAIVDISEPNSPKDVSFWAWPDQKDDQGRGVLQAYLHGPAYVRGDRAYLSYGKVGLVILDVSEVTKPELVSVLNFGDLGNWLGCHSAVPVPNHELLVVNSEAIEERDGDPLNYAFVVDIHDETAPRVISSLPMPAPEDGLPYRNYYAKGGRFGPHNQHQPQGNPAHLALEDHILMTYFNAGLRLYDISDPLQPIEAGWFVPEDPRERRGTLPTDLVTQYEDVIVDARGFIYCTDKNHGLFILKYLPGLR